MQRVIERLSQACAGANVLVVQELVPEKVPEVVPEKVPEVVVLGVAKLVGASVLTDGGGGSTIIPAVGDSVSCI